MNRHHLLLTSLSSFALTLIAPIATAQENLPLPHLIAMYEEDLGNLKRFYHIPFSSTDRERVNRFHQEWDQKLKAIPFDELEREDQIDYLLFKNLIGHSIKKLADDAKREESVLPLIPFTQSIVSLIEKRRNATATPAQEIAKILDQLGADIQAQQKVVTDTSKEKKPGQLLANRAARYLAKLRHTLIEWHRFHSGYDPTFSWWNDVPYRNVRSALTDYETYLKETFVGNEDTVVGDPIGREALLDALASEFIPHSPEELVEMGKKEYAWCLKEMQRASKDLGFGEDKWLHALRHVKDLHVAPGEQPQLIRELALEAVMFLERNDLLTIPAICKETWRMEMMTAERQKVNPYFTGGEVISVSFPTHEMQYADKVMSLRGNNRHFCRATVHHELIPGHHLQLYMAERYRPYRKVFRTPFFVEGWALYWEMLLWDMNFQRSAEDRVGMLFWRMHRCARIVFSINFHLGKMSAQEAIDYLVTNVGHERRNATAEVRRSVQGGYEPLYQAAYMLGGLQIRALRRELVTSGRLLEKQFHDALLRENSIPIELIRASLTEEPLTRDYQSQWKFYKATATNKDKAK